MGLKQTTAAAFLAVALAACGTTASVANVASSSSTAPPNGRLTLEHGGTVTVAVSSLPIEFNPSTPAGSNAVTQMVMEQVWPQPFVVGSGDRLETGPGLVTSAELVGVKPQTVLYTLAKNARWSDGVPITVADFVYDWHEFLAVGPSLPATFPLVGYESIASIRATRLHTVTVVFKRPYSDWQALFANLVPAHVAAVYGWTAAFAGSDPTHLVSGGPFTVSKVVPGRELVLTRNVFYWARPAHLSSIVFKVEPSESATLSDLASGRVDVAVVPPGPAVTSTVTKSSDLYEVDQLSPTLWQLSFNLADSAMSSLDLRLAIANLINRSELVADSAGLLNWHEFASSNHLFGASMPGHRRNDGPYLGSSSTIADQLLQSDGYSFNANGEVVSAANAPLVVTVTGPSDNSLVARVESELQAQLLQAGIALRVHNVPLAELLDVVLPRGQYQLALAPYLLSRFPSTEEDLYTNPVGPTVSGDGGTSGAPSGSIFVAGSESEPSALETGVVTRDVLGFDDPVVAVMFDRATSQLNFLSSSNLYNGVDLRLWGDMVALPLFQSPIAVVYRDDLVNVSYSESWSGPIWNAAQWGIQLSPPPSTTTSTAPPPG